MTCGDGMTCLGSARACAAAIPINGCPPGTGPCPNDETACVSDRAECSKVSGCPDGTRACGPRREGGRVVIDATDLKTLPICLPSCPPGGTRKPLQAAISGIMQQAAAVVRELKTTGNLTALRLKLPPMRAGQSPANISIGPIPLSTRQHGPFSSFVTKNNLMSELIEIVPSPGTTFSEDEPLEVSIPIVDASAGANESQCRSVASTLTVYKVENAADFDTPPFKLSWCEPEYSDASCFCQFNTTHFSAYGVVDEEAQSGQNVRTANIQTGSVVDPTSGAPFHHPSTLLLTLFFIVVHSMF